MNAKLHVVFPVWKLLHDDMEMILFLVFVRKQKILCGMNALNKN